MEITLTLDSTSIFSLAFLCLITMIATKVVVGLLMFVIKPSLDGISLWAFASVLKNMYVMIFGTIMAAFIVAAIVSTLGWPAWVALTTCGALSGISAFLSGVVVN